MGIGKEIGDTFSIVKLVLKERKYKIISLVFGLISFGGLYYLLVAKVADNDIWISVMMSGEWFVTLSIVNSLAIAGLSGVLLSMIIFKFSSYRKVEGGGFVGFVFSGVGAFGVGCPTCGAFLFGLIGMPLALMYLPFRGLELQVLSVAILFVSIYFTGKSIRGVCKI